MSSSTFRSTSFVPLPLRTGSTSIATFSAHSLRRTLPILASRKALPYQPILNSITLVRIVLPVNWYWKWSKLSPSTVLILNTYLEIMFDVLQSVNISGTYNGPIMMDSQDGVSSTSRSASSKTCSMSTFFATASDISWDDIVFKRSLASKSFIQSRKLRLLNV